MATTQATSAGTDVVYDLKGSLLEACSCNILCPCWVGEDPDYETCQAIVAWHFDEGIIKGVDVSGRTMAGVAFIPGNILQGNWRVAFFIDAGASSEQMEAILDAYTGKLGGPLADLAQLVGEVVAVEQAPITHEIVGGSGILTIGDFATAEMTPYRSEDGTVTTLRDSVFSTVPGSPAWVGKAEHLRVNLPQHGFEFSYEGQNAIQSDYHMVFAGS